MHDRKLRVALIGAGRIGRMHAAHIAHRLPEATLAAVVDLNEEAARACAERYQARWHTRYEAVLQDSRIDAVAICTTSTTHTEIIEAAAAAGKHIFCEKPIDLTLARIDYALRCVRKAGVLLQVGFQRRFDPGFQRVRQAITAGEIGEPHSVHIISRDPSPPPIAFLASSGGLFLDMSIHDFDMAYFLLRQPIRRVYATGAVRIDPAIRQIDDVDTATVVLQCADETFVTIENSRQATFGYDQRLEVFGSRGSIRLENVYPNTTVRLVQGGLKRDNPHHFFIERYRDAYVSELRAFTEAALRGGPSPLSGEDARVSVEVGLAALHSLRTGLPVDLAPA